MLGDYDVPDEALDLSNDIMRIELALGLLEKVNPWNITASDTQEHRDFGHDMLRSQIALLHTWHRMAKLKLREYLK